MTFKATLTALTLTAVMAGTFGTIAQAQTPPAPPAPPAAALFAKIDTNGDKVLSPDELRAYVAAQIAGLDANHDGYLTADEIAAKLTQIAQERVTMHATEMLKRADKAGDGKVTVEELAAMPRPMDRLIDRMLKAGGGKITEATFDTVMALRDHHGPMGGPGMEGKGPGKPMEGKGMEGRGPGMGGWRDHGPRGPMGGPGHERGGMMGMMGMMGGGMMPMGPGLFAPDGGVKFADIDTTHQGFITADSYQAWKLAQVKALDTSGDGVITPDELAAAAMTRIAPRIKAHAEEMVKRMDLNGDGKISIEELAAAPLDMMLFHLPTDKDGNVTEKAFERALDGHGPGGWHHHGPGRDHGMMPPPPPPADGAAPAAPADGGN